MIFLQKLCASNTFLKLQFDSFLTGNRFRSQIHHIYTISNSIYDKENCLAANY